jgi:hypothetical protein
VCCPDSDVSSRLRGVDCEQFAWIGGTSELINGAFEPPAVTGRGNERRESGGMSVSSSVQLEAPDRYIPVCC